MTTANNLQINSSQDSHFAIPFGGYKQSGIGRDLGEYALSAYTQVKAVHGKCLFAFSRDLTSDKIYSKPWNLDLMNQNI